MDCGLGNTVLAEDGVTKATDAANVISSQLILYLGN